VIAALILVVGVSIFTPQSVKSGAQPSQPAASSHPNIILITLDTVRRDHLSLYGYGRTTSPRLDAFAKNAWLFRDAYSTCDMTSCAHASIFTGKYPSEHGVFFSKATPQGGALRAEIPTLASILYRHG